MKRRDLAKGFFRSTAKQIACLSLAASVVATPIASYADTAGESAADNKMAPVSTVSEGEVLNILVPAQPTSTDPEQIAKPNAVYTDVSGRPEGAPKDAKATKAAKPAKEAKSGSRMAKLRKMASRMRVTYDKKQVASADVAAEPSKSEAKDAAIGIGAEQSTEATAEPEKKPGEKAPDAVPFAQQESDAANKTADAATSVETASTGEATKIASAVPADESSADAPTVEPVAEAAGAAEETINSDNAAPVVIGLSATLKDLEASAKLSPDGIMVVDNDEAVEQNDHLQYEEMPLDEGKQNIKIGARFPVVISSSLNSKTAKKGDRFEARLKYDLKIGDRLIAKKGSVVRGHLDYCLKARTILHSLVSPERWYRNSGCIGLAFDEIVNEKGEHIPCVAAPARAGRVIKNKAEGRELGVNHNGQVVGPWAQQLRYKAVRVGLNFAMAPAGVFSFGAMPVALGAIGAVNPNFAFGKPVGLNVRHRRIKGFAWGFLSGIPGSWLIEDTTVKGQEAIIKPGDEFYAAFKQEFNGEPETDASIMAGASAKVSGQVVNEKKPAKSSSKKK